MNTGESLQRACIESPTDATAKLAYADWCDENGEPLAAIGLRWMSRHGRHPAGPHDDGTWRWYARGIDDRDHPPRLTKRAKRMPTVPWWLPEVVGTEMSRRYPRSSRNWLVVVKRVGWAVQRVRDLVCD